MKAKYDDELQFERDLISLLSEHKGWKGEILKYKTEKDLIKNWADILYRNNRTTDRLGDYPLTEGEMNQILTQINTLRTPFLLNSFINGKVIQIERDNQDDITHFGKTISLKIYDRDEIAGGQSVYQIAEQPVFSKKSPYLPNRRGDFMLLINGMPLIHVELKRSGVPLSHALNQIQKYSEEGLFSGIFSLIQVFVAMTPEDMVYFANPGPNGKFNRKFFFHWENFNNEIVKDWRQIADQFLSIPMAHQLIGFYTVADDTDGILKVMRSYQYFAANAISDIVAKTSKAGWDTKNTFRGGYIWHTTGSGKTLTSFKAAQLIANSKDADKVVFLVDRIELGTQSYEEYQGFADDYDNIQATESTDILRSKLKSNEKNEILIVTSIQKMSRMKVDDPTIQNDIKKIREKRLVIIIDECHRSVFGEMLLSIQDAFPNALMFGFTGTPIHKENEKKESTTSSIFGNELHRYSISDGIRDGNVLGFDTYKVETFSQTDVRKAVALNKAHASTVEEALSNPTKKKIFYKYMEDIPMATLPESGKESIESNLPSSQYESNTHREMVCKNILNNWITTSRNYKYHSILATSSITEACEYYHLLKKMMLDKSQKYPQLKITALFDPHTDNQSNDNLKETHLVEILKDYNDMFDVNFSIPTYNLYKKDVSSRLSHKKPYKLINHDSGNTINILIVVNQMLTGFDSAWINTLHLDKKLVYEGIIQSFSRTNRLKDNDKPYGLIYYYRYPNTMELNVKEAFKIYSGNKPFGIFVDKLENNLKIINSFFTIIKNIFTSNSILNFSRIPENKADVEEFVHIYNELTKKIEAAKIQGFRWNIRKYNFKHENDEEVSIECLIDETTYEILTLRYKEVIEYVERNPIEDIPYDIDPSLITTSADKINHSYMESNFIKYVKEIQLYGSQAEKAQEMLNILRQSFSTLTQQDQKTANIIINDIQRGDLIIKENDTLTDLINQYRTTTIEREINKFCSKWLIPEDKFRDFYSQYTISEDINKYGNLDKLINCIDKTKVAEKLSNERNQKIPPYIASRELYKAITNFIKSGCTEE